MSNCNTCPSAATCSSKDNGSCTIGFNTNNNIKNVIGVMSGKGGVGKSTVSVLLAKQLRKKGLKVGILDADITGPSIPRLLGLKDKRATGNEQYIFPVETNDGIKAMSLNFLMEDENQPVIWRGPVITGVVQQFWNEVLWEELDYLIIDMPPGTGDVALTVMQSIPLTGLIMVSVPQDLISMIVSKAIIMAKKMNINVLGVIENMSYIICPDCGKKINIFKESNIEKFLGELDVDLLGELPMIAEINDLENYEKNEELIDKLMNPIVEKIIK
ncbi:Adenylyl-sulfate kinase [Caloramator mitchellensis]|uniref:Iron-sulfur cluster carrier protein n=1 Tax=Caloramator mitchellensis TaxID=908809 RepID=A0A0R3JRR5_CALMK|nr:Mrp/NBP35 family ATP-binding protein [Caloramator mitchellensis]KRQ86187.1 Adenylyl-sulfate kinase [Caloramator mitchellensis]